VNSPIPPPEARTHSGAVPISLPDRPRLGFDLDLTLIDMREATALALHRMNARRSERVDVDAVVNDLGVPFRAQLAQWIEEDRLDGALRTFVEAFLAEGMALLRPLPGAADVLADLRRTDGYSVVITGRRTRVARACLRRCGLSVGGVAGGVVGLAKAPAIREHHLDAYVGDTGLDMQGARAAAVPGIGVLSGTHTAASLRQAGATTVISSLTELSAWVIRPA